MYNEQRCNMQLQTEFNSLGTPRLQRQSDERDNGEDEARYEQVDDEVEWFAFHMDGES